MYISNFQADGAHMLSIGKQKLSISEPILGISSTRTLIPSLTNHCKFWQKYGRRLEKGRLENTRLIVQKW